MKHQKKLAPNFGTEMFNYSCTLWQNHSRGGLTLTTKDFV